MMPAAATPSPASATPLARLEARGGTTAEALALFDTLEPVAAESMIGQWRGATLRTGHTLDGVLEALGWYGKAFLDAGSAHPLLFHGRGNDIVAIDPRLLPAWLARDHGWMLGNRLGRAAFALVRPMLETGQPKARLRAVGHHGVTTTAMIYDDQPIRDIFRKADDDTLVGLMEMEGMKQPFFFVLRRVAFTGVFAR
jgi:hypothetical protein